MAWDKDLLWKAIIDLGVKLRKGIGLELAELDEIQSKFYKAAQYNAPRMGRMITEDDLNALRKTHK